MPLRDDSRYEYNCAQWVRLPGPGETMVDDPLDELQAAGYFDDPVATAGMLLMPQSSMPSGIPLSRIAKLMNGFLRLCYTNSYLNRVPRASEPARPRLGWQSDCAGYLRPQTLHCL